MKRTLISACCWTTFAALVLALNAGNAPVFAQDDAASAPETPVAEAPATPASETAVAETPTAPASETPAQAPAADKFLALEKASSAKTPEVFEGLKFVREFAKRLPNYWRALKPTKKQMESVYSIQREYFDEISRLEARVARLETERDARMRAVLTPKQQEKLDAKLAEVEKARAAKEAEKEAAEEEAAEEAATEEEVVE